MLVVFEGIDTMRADLDHSTSELGRLLNEMQALLQPLSHEWTGAASEAYQQAQQTWDDSFAEMVQLIGQLGGFAGTALTTYTTTEDGIREAWA